MFMHCHPWAEYPLLPHGGHAGLGGNWSSVVLGTEEVLFSQELIQPGLVGPADRAPACSVNVCFCLTRVPRSCGGALPGSGWFSLAIAVAPGAAAPSGERRFGVTRGDPRVLAAGAMTWGAARFGVSGPGLSCGTPAEMCKSAAPRRLGVRAGAGAARQPGENHEPR